MRESICKGLDSKIHWTCDGLILLLIHIDDNNHATRAEQYGADKPSAGLHGGLSFCRYLILLRGESEA